MTVRSAGAFLFVVGLVGACGVVFLAPGRGAPWQVACRVPARMAGLRPGMTEAQVLTTLGVARYRVRPLMGSGPTTQYHLGYPLRPGMGLALTFDCSRRPPLFLYGEVVGTDADDRATLSLCCLSALAGVWLWARPPRGTTGPTLPPSATARDDS